MVPVSAYQAVPVDPRAIGSARGPVAAEVDAAEEAVNAGVERCAQVPEEILEFRSAQRDVAQRVRKYRDIAQK